MSRTAFSVLPVALAVLTFVSLGGCMGKSQPAQFYTLVPLTEDLGVSPEGTVSNAPVGIGPITLADYLNQTRIVTRSGDNRVEKAEYDQWSGSLKDNLTNVLAENISHLLGSPPIFIYPWRSYTPVEYQVTVDIVRFDGQPGKEVVLVARWSILDGKVNKLITNRRSDIREKTDGNGYGAFVAAQSKALAKLSHEIVEAMRAAGRSSSR